MLKFLFKKRQELFINGNFKKFFFYAIGEISLVVIGILIAVQIDNWNNQRISSLEELALLKEMRNNLEMDIVDVRGNIGWLNDLLNSNQLMLSSLEQPYRSNPTSKEHFDGIYGTVNFRKNTSAYKNLESLGLNTIRNHKLRIAITNLYAISYVGIDNSRRIHSFFLQNHYFPEIIEHYKFDGSFNKAYPIDNFGLTKNHKIKELANYNCALITIMVNEYTDLEKEITDLLDLIKTEIGNRN